MISKAINDAYNRFIPHSTFPAYVLNLEVDPTSVDVNVHPRKLEVRFENEQNIFRTVYHAIEEKLNAVSLLCHSEQYHPELDSGSNSESFGEQESEIKQKLGEIEKL
jgi:DNA mismatch repair protein MutL